MISKKDNLLVRPWQQRKFVYHRQKVQSALPAIDNSSPPFRGHVCVKLKKQQKEKERCKRIEHDNYLLLQRLNYVMRTSRVDNTWRTPQPNFLNRVAMYNICAPQIEDLLALDFTEDIEEQDWQCRSRKSKCYACTPEKNPIQAPKIPEERVPWEPEKRSVSRYRSKSVPVRKSQSLPSIQEKQITPYKPSSSKSSERSQIAPFKAKKVSDRKLSAKEPHSIVFNRGSLQLSVNFPSDTNVKFHNGSVEKFLLRGICHCKNSPTRVNF